MTSNAVIAPWPSRTRRSSCHVMVLPAQPVVALNVATIIVPPSVVESLSTPVKAALRDQAPGPPGPLTMLPAVSPPSITITEPVK